MNSTGFTARTNMNQSAIEKRAWEELATKKVGRWAKALYCISPERYEELVDYAKFINKKIS